MNNIYISLGSQCTTATLFDILKIKKETLPFDWAFTTPLFVYTILKLLFIDNLAIDDIVDQHFFLCDKTAKSFIANPAQYINDVSGDVLINSKYNIAFPHDKITEREKYIRRLKRLKDIILDPDNFINFVYVSIPYKTYFKVNNIYPIINLYKYIEKINTILIKIRTNYKILVFDTDRPFNIKNPDIAHIEYHTIKTQRCWKQLLPELVFKFKIILGR